jgi:hypothetical protein
MKAERRHELKTNTLAQGLEGLPEFWRQYGGKVLLGVVAVLAIILFFRFQAQNARATQERVGESYAAAVMGIGNLQTTMAIRDPKIALEQRRQVQDQVETALQQVIEETRESAVKAEALVARGNLNWHLALMPAVRGSETQPSLKFAESKDELLDKSRRAYEDAIATDGAKPVTIASARLGLAAIAEQRGKWDDARKLYDEIIKDANTPKGFDSEARLKLDDLDKLRTPVLVGQPTTDAALLPQGPPVPPVPATTTPTTGVTTQPATATTAPTTATAPSTAPAK